MKYIIVEQHGIPLAILFDEILTHQFIASDKTVLSAGFCNLKGQVWGGSVSLQIKSDPEDEQIILKSIERRT